MTIGLPLGIRMETRVLLETIDVEYPLFPKTRITLRIPNGSPIVMWDCHAMGLSRGMFFIGPNNGRGEVCGMEGTS